MEAFVLIVSEEFHDRETDGQTTDEQAELPGSLYFTRSRLSYPPVSVAVCPDAGHNNHN